MAQQKYGQTDSEGNFHPAWLQTDEELKAIFDSTPGGIDAKLAAVAAAGPGYVGAVQWAQSMGMDVSGTGVGIAAQQAINDKGGIGGLIGQTIGPLIKPAIGVGGAIIGGLTAAPYLGLGGAGAAAGEGAAGAYGGMDAAALAGADFGATGSILGGGAAAAGGAAAGSAAAGGSAAGAAAAGGLGSILSNPAIIGAGLGLGASLLGGGNDPAGTTTSVEDIPEWLKPYANQGMAGLSSAFQNSPGGVSPLTAQGGGHLSDVIAGDYLNNNPYLDATFDRAAGKVSAGVNSQFSSAGRYGSGAHQGVLGESLGNLATDIYGGNYTRERANQQAAAMGAGTYGNTLINQPFLPAQNLLSGVSAIRGGTKTTPYFENRTADALSGALGGAMLGRLFG